MVDEIRKIRGFFEVIQEQIDNFKGVFESSHRENRE